MAFKPSPAQREQSRELRLTIPAGLYQQLEALGQEGGVDITECARQALAYAIRQSRRARNQKGV